MNILCPLKVKLTKVLYITETKKTPTTMPSNKSKKSLFQRKSVAASRPASRNGGALCCVPCTPFAPHQRLELSKFEKKQCVDECEVVKDNQKDAQFGSRVAMSKNGNVLVVAAPLYDAKASDGTVVANNGAVFVFERAHTGAICSRSKDKPKWLLRQRLVQQAPKTCAKELQGVATFEMFNFGQSIALSEDGFYIVVGAPLQDNTVPQDNTGPSIGDDPSGAVYIYARCPKRKGHWVPVEKLTAQRIDPSNDKCDEDACEVKDDTEIDALFGYDVDISRDGATVIVGAPGANMNEGAAYIYRRTCSVGLPNSTATFQRRCTKDSLYNIKQKLVRPVLPGDLPNSQGTMFGFSVALSGFGDLAAVSKPAMDLVVNPSFPNAGAVCIFENGPAYKFVEQVRLTTPDIQSDALFGTGVRITPDKRFMFVEAPGEDKVVKFKGASRVSEVGSVYVFERQCNNVTDSTTGAHTKTIEYVQVAKLCPDFSNTDIVFVDNDTAQMTSFDVSDDGCVVAIGYESLLDGVSFESEFEGGVVVFRFDDKKQAWKQVEILRPFDARLREDASRGEAAFGASVTVSGDGECLVAGETTGLQDMSQLQRSRTFAYSYQSLCGLYAAKQRHHNNNKQKKKKKKEHCEYH